MKDALGYEVEVGDTIAHIGYKGCATERTVLKIEDKEDGWDEVATISPEDCSWVSGRPGHNVHSRNIILIRKAGVRS